MIIFGVDPGTATTGYGVVKYQKSRLRQGFGGQAKVPPKARLAKGGKSQIDLIEYGCIVTPKDQPMPLRLYSIQNDLKSLLRKHNPNCVIVEQLFFGANSRTAMTVGQARGVILSTAGSYGLPVFEYQGLHVKHTLTGNGRADKKEVQKIVMRHLGKRKLNKPQKGYLDDAVDALAVAICHVIKTETLNAKS